MPSSSESQNGQKWVVDPALLLERAPSGVLVVDADGIICMVNGQAEVLFGCERAELIGAKIETLVPPRFHKTHLRHRKDYHSHPTLRPMGLGLTLSAIRGDGSEFPVEISLSPIDTPEGRFVMAAIRDVTDRTRVEDDRNILAVELETERERQRIGMDLHDGIMQEVYAVGLALELALDDIDERRDDAKLTVSHAIDELHNVIRNIRSYIFDLRPRDFTGDLSQALVDLAREFGQNAQIAAVADIEEGLPEIETERAITLYHIAHEALSNIRKHAGARVASVRLRNLDGGVCLDIIDDGKGFDTSLEVPEHHRGMRNMAKRAYSAGATFRIESEPGNGSHIEVVLPAQKL